MTVQTPNANEVNPVKQTFLDVTPPHWIARGLSYALIAIIIVGVIASVVIRLPETVTANFVLTPTRGSDPIKAARPGVVNRVFVNEGQAVGKGEMIATIRSEVAGDRAAELMTVQTQLAGAGESFENAKAKFNAQTLVDEQEQQKLLVRAEHLEALVTLKRQQLSLLKQLEASDERLFREGIVSRVQLAGRQLEVSELAAELERLLAEQAETSVAMKKVSIETTARQADFRELQRSYKESAATGEIRRTSLRAGLAGSDGNEVRLTAPCAGTILRMYIKDSGAVLHEGETVADLVCEGESLQAELSIPENGLGKLKSGQGVKLKYDAFPYQRYGVKYGTVAWLSPAADGATFRAHVSLTERDVFVQGQAQPLIAGMSGKAEIVVGNRSLIEFVLEPLRQLKENYATVPEQLSRK
ncbi:MAG TPA: HlyD family efflux transporter periplasmic adaptor subunit [Pyrinomonadaceae bacterium]|nr:HlyD family efflux transporter periplasmic adaptor subunit [Pyrinomonadaceae bacterium]